MRAAQTEDLFKYFRVEARELWELMQRGALDLEKGPPDKEAVADFLRYAHTLKGAARVVRLKAVADLAHQMEEALDGLRGGGQPVPAGLGARLFVLLDGIHQQLGALDVPSAQKGPRPKAALPAGSSLFESVRLEVSELDEVMEGQREASARLTLLRQHSAGLKRICKLAADLAAAKAPGKGTWKEDALELEAWLVRFERLRLATLDQAVRELDVAHARAGRMRLAPAASLFNYLERACRDAAETLGKSVRFEAIGGELRLDAPVIVALQEALQHVVRNAVVHGIESAQERVLAGKPEAGTVRVTLSLSARRAVLHCSDDGRGLDEAAIAKEAVARGLVPAGEALSEQRAAELLLHGGLSTSKEVTELAGRGLGLDVLRATVERLQGSLRLSNRPGLGLELRVEVPALLSAYEVLEVEAGGLRSLLPFGAVRSVQRLNPGEAMATADGEAILAEGEVLPLLALDACFGAPRQRPRVAVLLWGSDGLAALGVDRILGIREAVIQPLPDMAPASELALGASMDAAGDPCLVLDPGNLVRRARQTRSDMVGDKAPVRLSVLVVDDSLTTRTLQQSILEAAGYAVDLCASAEEGLACLRQRRYGLLLVDVEMPGMDGFELLELLQADPELGAIPAILVTSLSSPEAKTRGAAAGAKDFIVKGEFDQTRLLAKVAELLR